MSLSNYLETAVLNAIFNNASLAVANRYAKLHTGDPGEDGTANAATETTRKSITGAAAVGNTFTSTNNLVWSTLPATETFSHISIWDHVSAGNCLWVGALVSPIAKSSGQTFTIAAGSLIATIA